MTYSQGARELARGYGPASLVRAGAAWGLIAEEMTSVADDYDAVVAPLKASLARNGADGTALRLELFGRWLRELSLRAGATAHRAESASVAHSVAVLQVPLGTASETEADDRAAAAIMREYQQACRVATRPWRTPQPPGGPGRK